MGAHIGVITTTSPHLRRFQGALHPGVPAPLPPLQTRYPPQAVGRGRDAKNWFISKGWMVGLKQPWKLGTKRWWQLKVFCIFVPIFGERIQFYSYFFKWVETTN